MQNLAHFFLPRHTNNHKAKVLHSSSLLAIAICLVIFQAFVSFFNTRSPKVLGYAVNISVAEVQRLTNEKRAQNGLSTLSDNPILNQAALEKGKDMLAKSYWAHVAPDGTQPWYFFTNAGYQYKHAGENLARDFQDAQSAVEAWMASPTHKDNILSPNYKEIGIGVVEGQLNGVETTIIVQFFGTKLGDTPAAPAIAQVQAATSTPNAATITPTSTNQPIALTTATSTPTPSPETSFVPQASALVASSVATPFDVTRILSFGLIGTLVVVVAVDGFLINKRKIFRIAGQMPAHFIFLVVILILVILAKVGRII